MKPRPFSITGKFVEKLKATKQDSTEEENSQSYSEYVPKYIQKDWQRFFTKQIYAFGKDILYERNLLLEYGFTKQRPPNNAPGTSQYSLTEQDDKIILWGFGMIFATKNDAVFLWRHEFIPKLISVSSLPSHIWEPEQIPQCTVPNTSDEKRLMLKLVLKSMKWLQRYEEWVLKTAGQPYRDSSLKGQHLPSPVRLDEKWSKLSEKFPKILQTFESPEQDYNAGALEPLQTNLKQQSQKTKKACGACGDSWPEEVSFCPSCGWEGLAC